MSFLRPTVSSLRRAVSGAPEERDRHGGPPTTVGVTPHAAQPIFRDVVPSDYSHVSSRVDSGLRSRVRTSSRTRRTAAAAVSRSPSLREFADKCDSVIQRAQEMLERTREQELKVAKALEERKSKSPARRATPPPPTESTPQRTPTSMHGGLASLTSSPAMPNAPYTTPVVLTKAASSTPTPTSPSLPSLPAPPPTPAGFPRSPLPTQPGTNTSPSGPVGRSSPASLLQRIRQSWRRGPGQAGETYTLSPTPSAPDGVLCAGITRVSPRKSVRFASPDKLETVTPTKVVALSSDEEGDDEEDEETSEDEEEQDWLPPSKKTRAESSSDSHTPHRDSVAVPPAPPPSAIKPGSRSRSGSSDSVSSSASSPPSRGTVSPSPSHQQRSVSNRGRRSSGRSSTSSSRPPMDHGEVKEYVAHHTIRRSLSRISRADMEDYLREEGVALPADGHWLKRQLLAHIRALIKQDMARHRHQR
ncbi:hypothetical protein JIQ42_03342 [Leishmania sp. Namibia]|uniref:hypothetical protein n=1 Tax=Leishmania sp. Namibia TaxID=2802991 RepID=UPI001B56F977|nr:hypothetical protein JIQ42_03342 [Leishmania sp. Namibia]